MPCLPRLLTPKRDSKTIKTLRLVDYCPDSTPRIPHFVVLCAMHLEKTPTEERVYVSLENENAAAKLLTDFKTSRHSPDLTAHDNQVRFNSVKILIILDRRHMSHDVFDGDPRAIDPDFFEQRVLYGAKSGRATYSV
jgi:hypothetical protein